jgi:hypothetical protein
MKSPFSSLQIQPRSASSTVVSVVDVVSVERHLRLEPQGVARRQPAGQNPDTARPASMIRSQSASASAGVAVELEPVLTRVAGPRDDAVDPGDLPAS